MLAYGVAPRRSQVATGDTYASRYGHRFYPPSSSRYSPFAAGGGFPHGRGSPAPLCAKLRHPATSGKASLPLPQNYDLLQGVNCTAHAAPCKRSVLCCSTLVSPPQFFTRGAPSGRGSRRRGRLGGVRSTPRPLL